MLLHLPRMEGYGVEPRVKNGPALAGRGAEAVRDAIIGTITTLPEQLRRSLTWDRGKELAQHAQLRSTPACRSTSPTRTAPGNGAPTRTRTDSFASTFPRARTCPAGKATSSRPLRHSTTGPAKHSAGRHQPKLSTSIYYRSKKPVLRRPVEPGQYTSIKLTTRLLRAGVEASMGSVGDSYDNALAENLWMLIKTEGLRGRTFTTRAEANLALFEYIDGFYNPRRIQERLGFLSPIEFEEKYYAEQATAEPTNLNTRHPLPTS